MKMSRKAQLKKRIRKFWSKLTTGEKISNATAIFAVLVSALSLSISMCQNRKYFNIDKMPNVVNRLEIWNLENPIEVVFLFSNDGFLEALVDKIYFQLVDTTSREVLIDTVFNCFERVLSSTVNPCRVQKIVYMRQASKKKSAEYVQAVIARFGYHYECQELNIDDSVFTYWVAGFENMSISWHEINESEYSALHKLFP